MSRKNYKTYEDYIAAKKRERELAKKRSSIDKMMVISDIAVMLYGPIPSEEECPRNHYSNKVDRNAAVHDYCERIGNRYRKEFIRAWHREKNEQGDVIIVCTPFVNYSKDRVCYKLELTARGGRYFKDWITDKWDEIKNLQM